MDYKMIANADSISKTVAALKENGIDAMVVEDGASAKAKVLEIIPEGAEVMTMTSVTNDTIGVTQELNESGKYKPVRAKLYNESTPESEARKIGAAADYVTGSVHAVTEDGKVVIASNTGSQLPAYAYAGGHVVWVVGAQKIVPTLDEALKRIYDYVLPLESVRANKAYHITTGSFVSKLLIIHREVNPKRLHLIFVKEALGF
jgi:L-lactate utilization protein LutB